MTFNKTNLISSFTIYEEDSRLVFLGLAGDTWYPEEGTQGGKQCINCRRNAYLD